MLNNHSVQQFDVHSPDLHNHNISANNYRTSSLNGEQHPEGPRITGQIRYNQSIGINKQPSATPGSPGPIVQDNIQSTTLVPSYSTSHHLSNNPQQMNSFNNNGSQNIIQRQQNDDGNYCGNDHSLAMQHFHLSNHQQFNNQHNNATNYQNWQQHMAINEHYALHSSPHQPIHNHPNSNGHTIPHRVPQTISYHMNLPPLGLSINETEFISNVNELEERDILSMNAVQILEHIYRCNTMEVPSEISRKFHLMSSEKLAQHFEEGRTSKLGIPNWLIQSIEKTIKSILNNDVSIYQFFPPYGQINKANEFFIVGKNLHKIQSIIIQSPVIIRVSEGNGFIHGVTKREKLSGSYTVIMLKSAFGNIVPIDLNIKYEFLDPRDSGINNINAHMNRININDHHHQTMLQGGNNQSQSNNALYYHSHTNTLSNIHGHPGHQGIKNNNNNVNKNGNIKLELQPHSSMHQQEQGQKYEKRQHNEIQLEPLYIDDKQHDYHHYQENDSNGHQPNNTHQASSGSDYNNMSSHNNNNSTNQNIQYALWYDESGTNYYEGNYVNDGQMPLDATYSEYFCTDYFNLQFENDFC